MIVYSGLEIGYTSTGAYVDKMYCDMLNLTINNSTTGDTACDSLVWYGLRILGTYSETLQTIDGCDSRLIELDD